MCQCLYYHYKDGSGFSFLCQEMWPSGLLGCSAVTATEKLSAPIKKQRSMSSKPDTQILQFLQSADK